MTFAFVSSDETTVPIQFDQRARGPTSPACERVWVHPSGHADLAVKSAYASLHIGYIIPADNEFGHGVHT